MAAKGDDFPYAMLSRAMRKLKAEEIEMRHEFMCRLMSLLTSEGPREIAKDKEDVFLATSTTISLLPHDELNVHLPAMIAYFKLSVESRDPSSTVVSLIGDLFRALGAQSLPYLDGFCLNLFDLLARNKIPTKLRSSCVAALIDIANSVGVKNFWPYIAYTLTQLEYASSITVKKVSFSQFFFLKLILSFYKACHFFVLPRTPNTRSFKRTCCNSTPVFLFSSVVKCRDSLAKRRRTKS